MPICVGDTIFLSCDSLQECSYKWESSSGFKSNEQNPTIPDAVPEMSGVFKVIATDKYGKKATDSLDIEIYPKPEVDVGEDINVCSEMTIELNGRATKGLPPYQYTWTPETGLSDQHIKNPIATIYEDIAYTLFSEKLVKTMHF